MNRADRASWPGVTDTLRIVMLERDADNIESDVKDLREELKEGLHALEEGQKNQTKVLVGVLISVMMLCITVVVNTVL